MKDLITTCGEWCAEVQSGMASADDVLRALDFLKQLKEATAKANADMEAAVIGWINANGDLSDGQVRYYVGPNKTTKCLNVRTTLEAIFEAKDGDLDALMDCLSSNPFKPATTIKLIGPRAEECFKTEEVMDLKTGKPKGDRLQKHDPQFSGKKEVE